MAKMKSYECRECPLRGDNKYGGYDRIGLLHHIQRGWCEAIREIEEEEIAETRKPAKDEPRGIGD